MGGQNPDPAGRVHLPEGEGRCWPPGASPRRVASSAHGVWAQPSDRRLTALREQLPASAHGRLTGASDSRTHRALLLLQGLQVLHETLVSHLERRLALQERWGDRGTWSEHPALLPSRLATSGCCLPEELTPQQVLPP